MKYCIVENDGTRCEVKVVQNNNDINKDLCVLETKNSVYCFAKLEDHMNQLFEQVVCQYGTSILSVKIGEALTIFELNRSI